MFSLVVSSRLRVYMVAEVCICTPLPERLWENARIAPTLEKGGGFVVLPSRTRQGGGQVTEMIPQSITGISGLDVICAQMS